jgi:hypothetical protein
MSVSSSQRRRRQTSSVAFVFAAALFMTNHVGAEEPDFLLKDARFRPLAQCYASALQVFADQWQKAAARQADSVQELHRILVMTGGYGAAAEEIIPICNEEFREKTQKIGNFDDIIIIAEHVFRVEARQRQAAVYANCLSKDREPDWYATYTFCKKMYERDSSPY